MIKEEAVSGTVPMRERLGGARLLADAKAGALDVVLVHKLDRIGEAGEALSRARRSG